MEKVVRLPRKQVIGVAGNKEKQALWRELLNEAYVREISREWRQGHLSTIAVMQDAKKRLVKKFNIKNENLNSFLELKQEGHVDDPVSSEDGKRMKDKLIIHLQERRMLLEEENLDLMKVGKNVYRCAVCELDFSTNVEPMVLHIKRHEKLLPVSIWKTNRSGKWRPNEHMWDPRRQGYFGGGDTRLVEVRGLDRYKQNIEGVEKVICPCGEVIGNFGESLRARGNLSQQFIRHARGCEHFGGVV
jgi:hypothetical protein